MSNLDYLNMTNEELKQYILEHRGDQEAFHVYMDRRYARQNREAISPTDPDWQAKVLSSINDQLHSFTPPPSAP